MAWSKESVAVKYGEIELELIGEYFSGYAETWEEPGEESDFAIEYVMHENVDISELIDGDVLESLREMAIKSIEG